MPQLVTVVVPPLSQHLTYMLPEELESEVDLGSELEVPLQRRIATGFVIAKSNIEEGSKQTSFKIKEVLGKKIPEKCFNAEQLAFFNWIADYYGESLSRVIETAIPAPASPKFQKLVSLGPNADVEQKGKLQKLIVETLRKEGALDSALISRRFRGASQVLKKLEANGIVEIKSSELLDEYMSQESVPNWAQKDVILNEAQSDALQGIRDSIDKGEFKPFLLHGITGSGKTEVYIDAILHAAERGRSSLVIVPEIALTPQLIDRFRARLGNNLAVLHSALSKRTRWDSWRALVDGRSSIAIGARSGIFAPVENLGLIIVDEEHDSSFKQSDSLRYNARDLAIVRGKLNNAPVVLGSATPSLESYSASVNGRYRLLELPSRHGLAVLPQIELVDLTTIKSSEMASRHVSQRLYEAIEQTIDSDGQAFILYNRRGFASFLQCEKCGTALQCPNCSVTLTYHLRTNSLLCHYCSYSSVPPRHCGSCAERSDGHSGEPGILVHRGAGTERVVDEIAALFPGVSIERLDRDAAENLTQYRAILSRLRSGEIKILVGTQMIAKGHDLPNVTLVGIVDCDIGLNMPDFRASERAFQLLTQAAGRAGRGEKPGLVILQSRNSKHPSLVRTARRDYLGFAAGELSNRKALRYPPFCRLLRIVSSSSDQELASAALLHFKELLARHKITTREDLTILGPAPAPLEKLKTQWRFHLLIKSQSAQALNHAMRMLRSVNLKSNKIKIVFDIDPQDML